MGANGLALGRLVALSPGVKHATWEAFAGVDGQTVVRLAAEYDREEIDEIEPGHLQETLLLQPPAGGRHHEAWMEEDLAILPGALGDVGILAIEFDSGIEAALPVC